MRLIVRRVRPTPGSQLSFFTHLRLPRLHHRPRGRHPRPSRPTTGAMPRSRTPSGTSSTAWASTICRRAGSPPTGPGWRSQVMAHNVARWTARIGLGEGIVTTRTLRRRLFGLPGRLTRSARRITLHLPARWPWAERVPDRRSRGCGPSPSRPDRRHRRSGTAPRHVRDGSARPLGTRPSDRSTTILDRVMAPLDDIEADDPITGRSAPRITGSRAVHRWIRA